MDVTFGEYGMLLVGRKTAMHTRTQSSYHRINKQQQLSESGSFIWARYTEVDRLILILIDHNRYVGTHILFFACTRGPPVVACGLVA